MLTEKEIIKLSDEYNKLKIKCKHCGHKLVIPVWVDKQICSWCGNYVYRNKQMEFREEVKKLIKVIQ